MRRPPHRPGPGEAELARTALAHAPLLQVEAAGVVEAVDVRGVDDDGSVVLLVGADGPLAAGLSGEVPATVHAALLSPVPGPDRVLHRLTLHGRIEMAADVDAALATVLRAHPDRPADVVLRPDAAALLRVRPWHVALDGAPVELAAYAGARADPLARGSDAFVAHLLRDHPGAVVELAFLLDPALLAGARALAPVRVDRHGLTLRVESAAGGVAVRIEFPAPVRGPAELPHAVQDLRDRAARVRCPGRTEITPPRHA